MFEELSQRRLARASHTSVRANLCCVFSCQYTVHQLNSCIPFQVIMAYWYACLLFYILFEGSGSWHLKLFTVKVQLTIFRSFLYSSNTAYSQWCSFVLSIIIYEAFFFFFFFPVVVDIFTLHCIAAISKMLKTEFGINADVEHFPIHFAAQVAFKLLLRNLNKAK